jgi:ATP-dependent DNA ligase
VIPAAMEAKLVAELPSGPGWRFEPKWDGFRALVWREGDRVEIQSKSGKPLARYFPEVVAMIAGLAETRFLLDGELILPVGDVLSFDALQQRLHPAASRVARLARETPAQLMLFDLLAEGGHDLADRPFAERRRALDTFHARHATPALLLSPQTEDVEQAAAWLRASGGALDGVVAKRADLPYRPGERAMLKVKQHRTADCVVGGVRRDADGAVTSLLLGLYGPDALLHHVGFVSGLPAAERRALADRIAPCLGGAGFTGKAPGGPSRWTGGEARAYDPLAPELVVEVLYDQVTADRFRHGARLLRWRPDKAPHQCRTDQLIHELRPSELAAIV